MLKRLVAWSLLLLAIKLGHTPYSIPVYFIAVASMVYLWRGSSSIGSIWPLVLESSLLGMASAWVVTRFFSQTNTWAVISLVYGVASTQMLSVALAIRWFSRLSPWIAALLVGAIAALTELAHSHLFGITWVVTNISLTVAATPIAQWCAWLSPFGLTWGVVALGCLYLPDRTKTDWRRWCCTGIAMAATGLMWLIGALVEDRVVVSRLSIGVLMVQPHYNSKDVDGVSTTEISHQLTLDSLRRSPASIDLVLWPESVLHGNVLDLSQPLDSVELHTEGKTAPVPRFRSQWCPEYGTNCLVGMMLTGEGQIKLGTYNYPGLCNYNCGCLVTQSGSVDWHEKLMLVPIREVIPNWLWHFPWIRSWLTSDTNAVTTYQHGRNFHPLTFEDREGKTRRIAVAICYESWLPWLPQYHCDEPLDAICHLAYDGDFKDHPEYIQRMLLTIRLRAIETRTWQLVCTHFAGTAVIDPRGRIVKQLPPGPGVLRTDQLEQK